MVYSIFERPKPRTANHYAYSTQLEAGTVSRTHQTTTNQRMCGIMEEYVENSRKKAGRHVFSNVGLLQEIIYEQAAKATN